MYLAACAAPICLMLPFRIIAPRTASAVERLRDKDNPCYNVSMDSKEKDKLSERQKRAMQKAEDISRVEGIQSDEVEKQFIAKQREELQEIVEDLIILHKKGDFKDRYDEDRGK